MRQIDYSTTEELQARARRERSQEVYRLLCRAAARIASLFSANPALRADACCPNPA